MQHDYQSDSLQPIRLMFTISPHLETSIFVSDYQEQTMLLIYIYMMSN